MEKELTYQGFEHLYDESETTQVRFIGFLSDHVRYDFGIVYSNQFFGKPLVICMQTGRAVLLCSEEARDVAHIQRIFRIEDFSEADKLASFFEKNLPVMPLEAQY